jgi:16S rRNA (uracil1498-N3)-methyltransferase
VSDRFYVSSPITTDHATLDGPEAHHLLHVMRAAVGTQITVFDGAGWEFTAVVESVRRAEAELRIVERREINRELPFELVVGVALPKGDRQKWLVEKLTELGVTTLVPLVTERGVAQPTSGAIDRLSRSVIEAAKQCGRNRLMQITDPQNWEAYVSESRGESQASDRRIVAHPGGVCLRSIDFSAPQPTYVAIGPEGGLTDAEVSAAANIGWQQVSLGARILRVETAAIACAAAAALLGGDIQQPT